MFGGPVVRIPCFKNASDQRMSLAERGIVMYEPRWVVVCGECSAAQILRDLPHCPNGELR